MEEESLTVGEKIILIIGFAVIGGIIWGIVKIVEAVVSAAKATANFVVLNLDWTILGILLSLLIIILFKHLKHKYIGAAEGEDADPLFTRAAKYVVKKKYKLGSETEIVRRLSRKFGSVRTEPSFFYCSLNMQTFCGKEKIPRMRSH